ncbi:MAG: T9SS type B sorting domain-containing protein [Christiangramia sp.]
MMGKYYIALFAIIGFSIQSSAQLGFCSGSKGDPIFQEDFGQGSGTGTELGAGITSYKFVRRDPEDGEYTISDDIGNQITSWHHNLPETTVSGGQALIVNADYSSGQFYRTTVSGLCEATSYEFSAFLMNIYDRESNICEEGGIPNNVKFQIWDQTNSVLLKSGSTGDIASTNTPKWEQYALTFQSQPGQNSVILKMFNNGNGGCGNDLAIDDITFSSCGDFTKISAPGGTSGTLNICEENTPVTVKLEAIPDNSVYNQHFYQWQESSDSQNWQDIPGENSEIYKASGISSSVYFRVKVAEDFKNLSSNVCSSASEPFQVKIILKPAPPQSNGDLTVCSNESIPALEVNVAADEAVNWYDQPTGGNLLAENTNSFIPENEGIYYAEAKKENYNCSASSRTAVELKINSIPELEDEILQICPDSSLKLDAGVTGYTYEWSTGETTQSIIVTTAGNYSVKITSKEGCTTTKKLTVEPVADAQIGTILSEGDSVTINSTVEGAFLYSLDGISFQNTEYFEMVPGGIYTAYIKDLQNCNVDSKQFAHIVTPDFITPNNDGYNDNFELKGIEFFDYSEIQIFDRYGKIIKIGKGANFIWNGTFEGIDLPADDYWYLIKISGFEDQKGHFSLIR